MSKPTKRNELMSQFRHLAKEYDRICDMTLRGQASQNWRDLASDAEAARAPSYLTWRGRRTH